MARVLHSQLDEIIGAAIKEPEAVSWKDSLASIAFHGRFTIKNSEIVNVVSDFVAEVIDLTLEDDNDDSHAADWEAPATPPHVVADEAIAE